MGVCVRCPGCCRRARAGPHSFGYQPSQMIVMWSTEDYGDSVVMYGQDQFHLNSKQSGSCWRFTYGNPRGLQYMHRVLLEVRTTALGMEATEIFTSILHFSANSMASPISGTKARCRLLVLCRDVRQRQ